MRAHIESEINSTFEEEPQVIEYALRDPLLFGDYRNACNEEEPRYYEDLLDYEAIFSLFMEVKKQFTTVIWNFPPRRCLVVIFPDSRRLQLSKYANKHGLVQRRLGAFDPSPSSSAYAPRPRFGDRYRR